MSIWVVSIAVVSIGVVLSIEAVLLLDTPVSPFPHSVKFYEVDPGIIFAPHKLLSSERCKRRRAGLPT